MMGRGSDHVACWQELGALLVPALLFAGLAARRPSAIGVARAQPASVAAGTLRVCADPNNLPFSNRAQQGFENHLAALVAKDLGMQLSYFWYPQRQNFFKKTLNAGQCDVVMGVPLGIADASTTAPYYRSSYVFISRRDRNLTIKSMGDPRLRTLRIGVHITG